jgi:hypothetical protein
MRVKKVIALLGLLMVMVAGPAFSGDGHGHQRHSPPRHHYGGCHRPWLRPGSYNCWYPYAYRWPGYVYYEPPRCYPIVYEPRPVYQPPWQYPNPWWR